MKCAIVFVHGRGVKPPKDVYFKIWLASLHERVAPEVRADLNISCSMGYYADVFYSPTSVAGGAEKQAQGNVLSTLLDRFARDVIPERSALAASVVANPENDAFLFLEDVIKYFAWNYNGVVAKPVVEALDAVSQDDTSIMVISHSLGTMVMYDVLTEHPYKIDTWITLGAPLGWTQNVWARTPQNLVSCIQNLDSVAAVLDRTVLSFLRAREENPTAPAIGPSPRMEFPAPSEQYPNSATVQRWINVNDPADPVAALDPYLADDFPMPDGSLRAMDVRVDNPDKRPGDKGSAHSDPGYLRTWQVGQIVSDFLLRHR